jgi:hypothetical protein
MSSGSRWLLILLAILLSLLLGLTPEKGPSPAAAALDCPERTGLVSSGWAKLKGKVTYDGDPPEVGDFRDSMAGNKDKEYCLKADTEDPTWTASSCFPATRIRAARRNSRPGRSSRSSTALPSRTIPCDRAPLSSTAARTS